MFLNEIKYKFNSGLFSPNDLIPIDINDFDLKYKFISNPYKYVKDDKEVFILNLLDKNEISLIYIKKINKTVKQYILSSYLLSGNFRSNANNLQIFSMKQIVFKNHQIIIDTFYGMNGIKPKERSNIIKQRKQKIINIIDFKFEKLVVKNGLNKCLIRPISTTFKNILYSYISAE